MTELSRSPEPVHVCHVITGLGTGGAETALYRLLQNFDTRRYRMSVVSLSDSGTFGPKIADLGIPVECLQMRAGALPLKGMIRLRSYLSRAAPDVIQSWMYHANLLAALTSRLRRAPIPVIWNIRHSLDNLSAETPGTRRIIRAGEMLSGLAAAIIYNSARARQQHEQMGYRAAHGHTIPNGFELSDSSRDMTTRSQIRQTLDIPLAAPVIGRIGRFHKMKDYGTFLKAAALVNRSCPEAHFLLCGRDVVMDNRELRTMLQEQAVTNLHLLGERSDVPQLLTAMDVVCSSSAFGEGFPNVLGEAMAAGLPCVTTDVGDSARIVGDTGFVIPPRDAAALAQALTTLLQMPAAQRAELGARASERVEQHYSMAAIVSTYQNLYQTVHEVH